MRLRLLEKRISYVIEGSPDLMRSVLKEKGLESALAKSVLLLPPHRNESTVHQRKRARRLALLVRPLAASTDDHLGPDFEALPRFERVVIGALPLVGVRVARPLDFLELSFAEEGNKVLAFARETARDGRSQLESASEM